MPLDFTNLRVTGLSTYSHWSCYAITKFSYHFRCFFLCKNLHLNVVAIVIKFICALIIGIGQNMTTPVSSYMLEPSVYVIRSSIGGSFIWLNWIASSNEWRQDWNRLAQYSVASVAGLSSPFFRLQERSDKWKTFDMYLTPRVSSWDSNQTLP